MLRADLIAEAARMQVQYTGAEKWHKGLCECFSDLGACAEAFCLPCISSGYIAAHTNEFRDEPKKNFNGGICCLSCVCFHGQCAFSKTFRSKTAVKFNLEDPNQCSGFCCCPCSNTQIIQHYKHRGVWRGSLCTKASTHDNDPGKQIAPPPPSVMSMVNNSIQQQQQIMAQMQQQGGGGVGVGVGGAFPVMAGGGGYNPQPQQMLQQQQMMMMQPGFNVNNMQPGFNNNFPSYSVIIIF
jgi:Cys-rich protein (TIGR01571 family)